MRGPSARAHRPPAPMTCEVIEILSSDDEDEDEDARLAPMMAARVDSRRAISPPQRPRTGSATARAPTMTPLATTRPSQKPAAMAVVATKPRLAAVPTTVAAATKKRVLAVPVVSRPIRFAMPRREPPSTQAASAPSVLPTTASAHTRPPSPTRPSSPLTTFNTVAPPPSVSPTPPTVTADAFMDATPLALPVLTTSLCARPVHEESIAHVLPTPPCTDVAIFAAIPPPPDLDAAAPIPFYMFLPEPLPLDDVPTHSEPTAATLDDPMLDVAPTLQLNDDGYDPDTFAMPQLYQDDVELAHVAAVDAEATPDVDEEPPLPELGDDIASVISILARQEALEAAIGHVSIEATLEVANPSHIQDLDFNMNDLLSPEVEAPRRVVVQRSAPTPQTYTRVFDRNRSNRPVPREEPSSEDEYRSPARRHGRRRPQNVRSRSPSPVARDASRRMMAARSDRSRSPVVGRRSQRRRSSSSPERSVPSSPVRRRKRPREVHAAETRASPPRASGTTATPDIIDLISSSEEEFDAQVQAPIYSQPRSLSLRGFVVDEASDASSSSSSASSSRHRQRRKRLRKPGGRPPQRPTTSPPRHALSPPRHALSPPRHARSPQRQARRDTVSVERPRPRPLSPPPPVASPPPTPRPKSRRHVDRQQRFVEQERRLALQEKDKRRTQRKRVDTPVPVARFNISRPEQPPPSTLSRIRAATAAERQQIFVGLVVLATNEQQHVSDHTTLPSTFTVPAHAPWPQPFWGTLVDVGAFRHAHRDGLLLASTVASLDALRFVWDTAAHEWQLHLMALQRYKDLYGDVSIPHGFEVPANDPMWPKDLFNVALGRVAHRLRVNAASLSVVRRSQLSALGFIWDVEELQWRIWHKALRTFHRLYDHVEVPLEFNVPDKDPAWTPDCWTEKLGAVVAALRQESHVLTAERKAQLDVLGFVWGPGARPKPPHRATTSSKKKRVSRRESMAMRPRVSLVPQPAAPPVLFNATQRDVERRRVVEWPRCLPMEVLHPLDDAVDI
ncbi:hypothetical protein SDRG_11162 [Saprolegnia diclina VS20]|uniref:Helicase-associated domain-containing protein n=1 Tax=Saprolegnia diclina (strain VS20) TaxID=1156394 RepID=T0Q998_SAPDV|nr:hypothetical protein SDRG_11162 [Saprolegnia diclina VS20]EQC31241.1 hypothetical protein SDRG_11162 [Saprolegnia diclina VS20]|eukprot:XP_008615414.1 hypothetical protein SDRG_11162 [Saprolegnia diclina VS20]